MSGTPEFIIPQEFSWGGDSLPEQEVRFKNNYTVEMKYGGRPVSLGERGAVDALLPTKPGIYFIYVNNNIWYVGKANNIRERFQERLKAFTDFKITPEQYLPLLRPVTVTWYEMVRYHPVDSSFESRGSSPRATWRSISADKGLLLAMEQDFISKYGTRSLGNKATECVRLAEGGSGAITTVYDFGAKTKPSRVIKLPLFPEKCRPDVLPSAGGGRKAGRSSAGSKRREW